MDMVTNVFSIVVFTVFTSAIGGVIGYYLRQSIAKNRAGSLEARLQKKVQQVKEETAELVKNSENKAAEIVESAQKDIDQRRKEFLRAEHVLLERDKLMAEKMTNFDRKEAEVDSESRRVLLEQTSEQLQQKESAYRKSL